MEVIYPNILMKPIVPIVHVQIVMVKKLGTLWQNFTQSDGPLDVRKITVDFCSLHNVFLALLSSHCLRDPLEPVILCTFHKNYTVP